MPVVGSPRVRLSVLSRFNVHERAPSHWRRVEVNSVVRYILALAACLAVMTPLEESSAQGREDGTITVVQPKPVLRRQRVEFVPRASWTFNDPVSQSFGLGGSLYYNATERFSFGPTFEWFDFGPKLRGTTGRYDDVIDTTSYVPQFVLLDFYAGLDLTYVPAFGKFVMFRKSITYFDVYVTLSGGVVRNSADVISPAGAVAVGTRLYFNRWLGMSLEYRNRLSIQEMNGGKNRLWSTASVALGLNILLPFNFKYKHEEGDR